MSPLDDLIPPLLKGWEQRVQLTWIAPPRKAPAIAGNDAVPGLRANLVVSIVPTQHADPQHARKEFLEQTATTVPGLEVMDETDEVPFDDDAQGCQVVVEFHATGEVRLRQTHIFRIDGDSLSQLVATVDAEVGEDEDVLLAAARAYHPPTSA